MKIVALVDLVDDGLHGARAMWQRELDCGNYRCPPGCTHGMELVSRTWVRVDGCDFFHANREDMPCAAGEHRWPADTLEMTPDNFKAVDPCCVSCGWSHEEVVRHDTDALISVRRNYVPGNKVLNPKDGEKGSA